MHFGLFPWRFTFRGVDSIHFPAGKSGNIIRGAFGILFRGITCARDCPGATHCNRRETCAYARIFEPSSSDAGPSGLADRPRPFVFRAAHLDGKTIPAGGLFHFDIHVFDLRDPPLASFVLAFAQLAREGLGPRRGRAVLERVAQLDPTHSASALLFEGGRFVHHCAPEPLLISLDAEFDPVSHLTIRFETPTEVKVNSGLAGRPDFGPLFARVRDRISTLSTLYGPGPLALDFRAMGERANRVRLVRADLRQIEAERRSSRTGQVHPLGGFVGEAEYSGDLAEFLPFLRAAEWTGVGRQTVWGKGAIRVAGAALSEPQASGEQLSDIVRESAS